MMQIITLLDLTFLTTVTARSMTYEITVTNIAYLQPFGGFFVAVHNEDADPVFELGAAASPELAILAEEGSPNDLVTLYDGAEGVLSAVGVPPGDGPLTRGESLTFTVEVNPFYPLVSFASMAINTNDCFVGVSGMTLWNGMEFTTPGYDAGSEENNELCSSIPGPACPGDSGNSMDGNGEGVVHIHRGVFGIGDLEANLYDWRNPMMLVTVKQV